MKHITLMKNR